MTRSENHVEPHVELHGRALLAGKAAAAAAAEAAGPAHMPEAAGPAHMPEAAGPAHMPEAAGPALVLEAPLSLWGGLDPGSGRLCDHHHPQLGATIAGRVLVMPSGRGSSSSSSVLAEAIRLGTAPAAILLAEPDEILVLGAIVAEYLYGRTCPIVVLPAAAHATIATGDQVVVRGNRVALTRSPDVNGEE